MKRLNTFSMILILLVWSCPQSLAFTFSGHEEQQRQQEQQRIIIPLADPSCRNYLRGKKIALVISEQHQSGSWLWRPDHYGNLYEEMNARLRLLGMETYSPGDITAQIAQAEMEAVLNNDLDAAASAASRLKANYFIKGIISTRERTNPVVGIQEVFVTMNFSLTDTNGKTISTASASGAAFSGADTLEAALALIRENGDQVISTIYNDYCRTLTAQ